MKNLFLTLIVLSTLVVGCNSDKETAVEKGQLTLLGNWAPEGLSWRDVWVWTPPGYDSTQSYPVLYMHDGQMLFDSTNTWNHQEWKVDETMERLIAEGKIQPTIVVAIANGGSNYRTSDYFPENVIQDLPESIADSLVQNDLAGKARGNRYVDFLIRELKPFIEERYAVSENPMDHYIMGSSMGGLISMYATFQYPEEFGGAACLSTHWLGARHTRNKELSDAILNYAAAHLPNPYATHLYFDHGTVGLDSLYAPYQSKMDSILVAHDFIDGRSMSKVFEGADHNEHSWSARLDVPLIYLLGKNE